MSTLETEARKFGLEKTAEIFEDHIKRAGRAGISFGQAETAAKKALRKAKKGRNRRQSLTNIGKAIAESDILMAWFAEAIKEYGRLDYHSTGDLLGDAMWGWKEDWEINPSDEEYEELSIDPYLTKYIQKAAEAWAARGGGIGAMPRDYAEASMIVGQHRGLNDLLKDLASGSSYDEEADRQEALARIQKLLQILK